MTFAPFPDTAAAADPVDPPFGVHSICHTLAVSDATLERFAWLGDNLAVAIWTRETREAETAYEQPGHHTLSCYLDGGHRTERQKLPGRYGAPSRLCALPGDHESRWWVRGHMHFVHLYFLPEHFTRRAIRELDREPRELTLADRTYFEDARIASLCQSLVNDRWEDADGRLRANETAHEVLSLLLRSQGVSRTNAALKGGLAVATRRRLRDYIDSHLTQALTLGELADVANLSEYHLSRMFRVSFGLPPHAWIAQQRVERARELLRTTSLPLADVATRCGYANASHFSHRFREAVGAAPIVYRSAMRDEETQ
ncbi:AraC family transcriptional regulator [Paraburkholderia edwinii]|uniref:AraC family transcriptional regulator n=1 Tax=Paraburkholderia edwinii TaxID=2861782 RepID=A0ABX8UU01_9BURK|nr:AraC family transcriptional regulator [Paraburkholderia edwinii]QYD72494.1 AraC family transcriptional regulator [Paraburkholderia edwinii]